MKLLDHSTDRFFTIHESSPLPLQVVNKIPSKPIGEISNGIEFHDSDIYEKAYITEICEITDLTGEIKKIFDPIKSFSYDQLKSNISSTRSDNNVVEISIPVNFLQSQNDNEKIFFIIPKPLNSKLLELETYPHCKSNKLRLAEDNFGRIAIVNPNPSTQKIKYKIQIDKNEKQEKLELTNALHSQVVNSHGFYTMHQALQKLYAKASNFYKTFEALDFSGHCLHLATYLCKRMMQDDIEAYVVNYLPRSKKNPNIFHGGYTHHTVVYKDTQNKWRLINLEDIYGKTNLQRGVLQKIEEQLIEQISPLLMNIEESFNLVQNTFRHLLPVEKRVFKQNGNITNLAKKN